MNRKSVWVVVIGLAIVFALWFLSTRVWAQEKPVVAQAASAEPQFTKEQSLQLENYLLRDQTIQTQMALLQQAAQKNAGDREAYIQQLEKEHPGWLLNRQTLKWEKAPVAKK